MKMRFRLAAAALAATAGVASAQQFQVQIQQKAYPAEPPKPTKPADTEFKVPADAKPDPKTLDVPADLHQKAKDLTAKLASPSYKERVQASKELATMGRMALPALQEVITSAESMEAVERAEALLPKAEAEDMKARVVCFLADAKGEYTHTLPGWEKFKTVTGNDKASRELFADVIKSNTAHQMLLAADKGPDEVSAVLNAFMTKLVNAQNGGFRGGWDDGGGRGVTNFKSADIVTALFLEGMYSDKEVSIQPSLQWWGGQQYYTVLNYLYQGGGNEVSTAMSGNGSGKWAQPIRKLIERWADTRETGMGGYYAHQYTQNMFSGSTKPEDRKRPLKYAAKAVAASDWGQQYWNKINLLTNLGTGGAKEYVGDIAKGFDDTTTIYQAYPGGNPAYDIQMRDYALAVALQLTDQKPEDYGFSRSNVYGNGNKGKDWNNMSFYFTDDVNKPNPNGGGGVRPRPVKPPVDPKEEKKDDTKDEKKDEKKDKLTQDDRRKAAFKKWDEWYKENGKKDDKKDPKADAPKKDDTKKDEPKKDGVAPTTPAPLPGGPGDPAPAVDLPRPKK